MTNELMPLLQLSDSQFPSGAFAHSFGFETYIQEDVVTDADSFKQALVVFLKKQLVYNDGLAFKLAMDCLEQGDRDYLMELDHLLFASCVSHETREGNRRVGARMAKLCQELYESLELRDYLNQIKEKTAYGHAALVFACVYQSLKISKEAALETFLFTNLSSLVQNAVRGIPIGQTDGQKILVDVHPVIKEAVHSIMNLSIEDLGAGSPGLEIAQMHHERLYVRLFMS
ncbi:urease accessory protein UreF [Halobacillus litoralis]|uniref:urease accessory protein UreF n=1 Tax=Halobacillus litoralis TaxID=45668 RepID=UPI001CFC7505|nr:urease accessory protein UreF [Halobacillus litoralis]